MHLFNRARYGSKRMEEIKGVEITHLLPEDKVLIIFDTEVHTIETAQQTYKYLDEFFEGRRLVGVYGVDIKFIREEEENAENNYKKYYATLRKGV